MNKYYSLSENVKITVEELKNQLWELVNSSSYNFVKEPLPVFYVLLTRYCNQDLRISEDEVEHYVTNLSFEYDTDRGNLLDIFPESCKTVLIKEKELFDKFFSIITNDFEPVDERGATGGVIPHGFYKYLHRELVEFFIHKYSELSNMECIFPSEILKELHNNSNGDGNEDSCFDASPVYIPFSGLSSYLLYALEEGFSFINHCFNEEPNENLAFMAKVRLNAWGYLSNIVSNADPVATAKENSLAQWKWANYWVMVSIPPFGLKVEQEDEHEHEHGHKQEIDVAEFLINRFIDDEKISNAYLVLPISFCYSPNYEELRKRIIDEKFLTGVIEIPQKSFKTTSNGTVIVALDKCKHDAIYFGHLNKKDKYGWTDTIKVDNSTVVNKNYLIVPSLYITQEFDLNDGQEALSIGELVEICEPETSTNEEVFLLDETDFIESTDDLFVEKVLRRGLPLDNMNVYLGKCIVLNKRLNGIAVCPIEGTFATNKNSLVLRLKENKRFSLNYLAHSIITNEQIKATSFYGTQLDNNIAQIMLDIKLPIYATRNMQEALMVRLKDEYIQMKEREFKKEMERYGIRAASSDLNHLLGPTYSRIHSLLNQLRKDCEEQSKVDSIRDNIEYMDRMIKHAGLDFKNYDSTLEETGINKFFQEYIEACRNISTTSFELKYETDIDEDTTFCVDKDMFRYLLDTIMDNVYRHGFDKRVMEGAVVQVTTTPKLIDDKPYLVLSIANNGKPLAEDFSIEKFIGRGEKCGSSAHSGLGGYHIYHIIKNHKGYLNMTSSSKWSVIYEILIPIEDLFDDKTKLLNYENRTSAI